MLIESSLIIEALYQFKKEAIFFLDKGLTGKIKSSLEAKIYMIDTLIMWIHNSEKYGGEKMEDLKLGELTTWEQKPKEGSIDEKIIHDAKNLKRNHDAIRVTVSTIKWTTFANRIYRLRGEERIPDNVVPRKDSQGNIYLVYMDEPNPKRSKKN